MKKKNYSVFKLVLGLIFCSTCIACSDDNDNANANDDEPELVNLFEEFIQEIEASNGKTYKITNAKLTNNTVTDLDIITAQSVKDDEFKFSLGLNNSLNFTWNKDHRINYEAASLGQVNLDQVDSASFVELLSLSDNSFSATTNIYDMQFVINENATISLIININSPTSMLKLELNEKMASDYITTSQIGIPTEIYSIETFLTVIDMQYSLSQNSLYFFNSKNYSQEQFIKYDLSTGVDTYKISDYQNNAEKQFEFVNGGIFGMTYNRTVEIDYNFLNEPQSTVSDWNLDTWNTLTAYGDNIYVIGGYGILPANEISKYNLSSNSFETFATLPHDVARADGIAYNDKLYVFGGVYNNGTDGFEYFDDINIYSMQDGSFLQDLTMPSQVAATFTARNENSIYVAGTAVTGVSGGSVYTKSFLGTLNTENNTFNEIDLSAHFPENYHMRNMTVAGDKIYFAFVVPNFQGLKIFEASFL